MKKEMISQPMNGLTDEQIEETRNRAIAYLESQGYEVDILYLVMNGTQRIWIKEDLEI